MKEVKRAIMTITLWSITDGYSAGSKVFSIDDIKRVMWGFTSINYEKNLDVVVTVPPTSQYINIMGDTTFTIDNMLSRKTYISSCSGTQCIRTWMTKPIPYGKTEYVILNVTEGSRVLSFELATLVNNREMSVQSITPRMQKLLKCEERDETEQREFDEALVDAEILVAMQSYGSGCTYSGFIPDIIQVDTLATIFLITVRHTLCDFDDGNMSHNTAGIAIFRVSGIAP